MAAIKAVEAEGFDDQEYLRRARERRAAEEEARSRTGSSRALLEARDASLGLERKSGKRTFVKYDSDGRKVGAGYTCTVCGCTLRDSAAYLSHLNSRSHLSRAGIKMRVKRSSVEQVKNRFLQHSKKRRKISGAAKTDDVSRASGPLPRPLPYRDSTQVGAKPTQANCDAADGEALPNRPQPRRDLGTSKDAAVDDKSVHEEDGRSMHASDNAGDDVAGDEPATRDESPPSPEVDVGSGGIDFASLGLPMSFGTSKV